MEEKFKNVLQENEQILWVGNVNKKAYVLKNALSASGFSLFASIFLMFPAFAMQVYELLIVAIGVPVLVFLISLFFLIRNAKNTYFCITDQRIIKRSGVFNNDYISYSLKNVSTVSINASIFDSKENKGGSASLKIVTTHFYASQSQNGSTTVPQDLTIVSLNQAYEASRVLNKLVKGNNENLRIEMLNK